jgi:hypothetical protein
MQPTNQTINFLRKENYTVAQTTITIDTIDQGGHEIALVLPAKFEVCPTCEGKGTHVNPSIDGHGLTAEDFADDPDFEEAYFRGDYDVQCRRCKGERVVAVIDRPRLSKTQKAALRAHERQQEEAARDDASERWLRMAESGERY